jgi:hypothetical protein
VFPSKDTVLTRPDGDPARQTTVAPGAYTFAPPAPDAGSPSGSNAGSPSGSNAGSPGGPAGSPSGPDAGTAGGPGRIPFPGREAATAGEYQAVWWDPHVLALDAGSPFGLRRDDLIARDGDPAGGHARLAAFRQWEATRASAIAAASVPSVVTRTATQVAGDPALPLLALTDPAIELVDVSRVAGRPFGPRFGTLVHSTLATVPLNASDDVVKRIAGTQGRILLGFGDGVEEEVYAAVEVVTAVLRHPLFDRVRAANAAGRCYRELPIIWQAAGGTLIEGTIDLAFEEPDGEGAGVPRRLVVLDFKTDRELDAEAARYRRQLSIYCQSLAELWGQPARGVLMRV